MSSAIKQWREALNGCVLNVAHLVWSPKTAPTRPWRCISNASLQAESRTSREIKALKKIFHRTHSEYPEIPLIRKHGITAFVKTSACHERTINFKHLRFSHMKSSGFVNVVSVG